MADFVYRVGPLFGPDFVMVTVNDDWREVRGPGVS